MNPSQTPTPKPPSLIDLAQATHATSGGKAAPLARLLRAGLPVPPGFVVTTCAYERALAGLDVVGAARHGAAAARTLVEQAMLEPSTAEQVPSALARLAGPDGGHVAVRSSATTEDGVGASAAGQHDTVLGVRGTQQVLGAVRRCWSSLWSDRAVAYRRRQPAGPGAEPPSIAVLVQHLAEADVAGVMFTGPTTRIEASWGLGDSVVSGHVTPDSWQVSGGAVTRRSLGSKRTRRDRAGTQLLTEQVPPADQNRFCLRDQDVLELDRIGQQIQQLLGQPHDIEWAIADGQIWILQARPITAALPTSPAVPDPTHAAAVFTGTPASPGVAQGPVRVVHGPEDFDRVQPGDILVCRTTDPAWTPLFSIVAAVVTEHGGLLSHAAIVAREHRLPAVLAVPHATTALPQEATATVDGTNGLIALASR